MAGVSDDGVLEAETRAVIAGSPDVLLATTSYGMRRWLETADAAGIGDALTAQLEHTRILVRGPKARGAIRAAGLDDQGMSERETTTSLVDLVLKSGVKGKTVAVQLHGFTDPTQLARLEAAGATVLPVAPYRWTQHEDSGRVLKLIDAICASALDAVTFTSAPAVESLFKTAEAAGKLAEIHAAFRGSVIAAAVGPVTAAPLVEAGILPIIPDRFRMGALIRLLCEHLEQAQVKHLNYLRGTIELRGRIARVGGIDASLSPVGLALFRTLIDARGATVSRAALASSAPEALDDHGVDVAISRLRQQLPDKSTIRTVVKRGYRIDTP
ncbi:MAG: uroporphyrinogen synthetase [Subtercola sp.]|nr:uroporphyrinogen synthetase [Subtercola sp.]